MSYHVDGVSYIMNMSFIMHVAGMYVSGQTFNHLSDTILHGITGRV